MAVKTNKGKVTYRQCPICKNDMKAERVIRMSEPLFKGMVFTCDKHGKFDQVNRKLNF